jgi:ketosteroid isomerase-like protein
MRTSLLALALLLHAGSVLADDSRGGPAATVDAYHAALAAGDAAAAEALLAADAIVLESGGVESRDEYLAGHLAADIEFSRSVAQRRSDVRVVQAGDVAWVSATSRATGEFRGRAIRSTGAELIVLSRSADGWRIRAIHWSSHPSADAPAPGAQ